jgi:hypothetical protein
MPSIGQTWVLASIGAVVEMGIFSTLKRLLMESKWDQAFILTEATFVRLQPDCLITGSTRNLHRRCRFGLNQEKMHK